MAANLRSTIMTCLLLAAVCTASAAAPDSADKNARSTTVRGHLTLTQSVIIDAAPETLWSTVRDFDAISLWHPRVEASDLIAGKNNQPGARRKLTLADDGHITEQLIAWSDHKRRYAYRIIDGVLPVTHYRAMIAVEAQGREKSRLVWKARFDAAKGHSDDAAKTTMRKFYRAGLDHVKTMIGGSGAQ